MSTQRDYYEILGVGRNASPDEIKRAYRRLVKQYHPDIYKGADADERIKEINEAYEVLSNPEKRNAYDRFGHAGVQGAAGAPGAGFSDFADIFEEFFGGGFGFRRGPQRGPVRGADLRYNLTIEFEEAVLGAEKDITITRHESCPRCGGNGAEPGTTPIRCPTCNGTGEVRQRQQTILGTFVNVTTCPRCRGMGEIVTTACSECNGEGLVEVARHLRVKIPPGVDEGTRIRLPGEGEPGLRGGAPGNLYVFLSVKPHKIFHRSDDDILLELPINIAQAVLGAEVEVPTLDGPKVIRIQPGTQPGKVLRLRGLGVPHLRKGGRGDMLITVNVRVPTPSQLTDEQRELFERLAETLGTVDIEKDHEPGFFDRMKEAFGL
ncbi:MAG: molecular chaperone DnaJ [Caldilineae bacterium]|nr:MAG: molecular chaperone DnaJ [Caldilineae bacterium]